MEILTPPKSKKEKDQWYGNGAAGCPSKPEVEDAVELGNEPIFVHPAEKPQGAGPVYRANLYDTF
jgi:hypothetical protein